MTPEKLIYDFRNVGNIDKKFRTAGKRVIPVSLLTNPALVLKMYSMIDSSEKKFTNEKLDVVYDLQDFIEKEICEARIKPCSGLGFAIASDEYLNVAVWDKDCPIILRNWLYEFKNNDVKAIRPVNLKEGAFCIYELGIVNHEKNAWKEYLDSKRKDSDKSKYATNTFKGVLK